MVTAAAPVLAGTRPMAEAGRRSGSRRGEDTAAGALDGGQGGGLVERRHDRAAADLASVGWMTRRLAWAQAEALAVRLPFPGRSSFRRSAVATQVDSGGDAAQRITRFRSAGLATWSNSRRRSCAVRLGGLAPRMELVSHWTPELLHVLQSLRRRSRQHSRQEDAAASARTPRPSAAAPHPHHHHLLPLSGWLLAPHDCRNNLCNSVMYRYRSIIRLQTTRSSGCTFSPLCSEHRA